MGFNLGNTGGFGPRIARQEYWMLKGTIFGIGVITFTGYVMFLSVIGDDSFLDTLKFKASNWDPIQFIFGILLFYGWIQLDIWRWRDLNLRGWVVLLIVAVMFLIGFIFPHIYGHVVLLTIIGIYVVLGAFKGTTGPNRYGPDPSQMEN